MVNELLSPITEGREVYTVKLTPITFLRFYEITHLYKFGITLSHLFNSMQ